ncbi:MAG: hypothetical protein RML10_05795 [Geminocystis sp.]|nr:hypothetical protein [Geminocystis sp.]
MSLEVEVEQLVQRLKTVDNNINNSPPHPTPFLQWVLFYTIFSSVSYRAKTTQSTG